MRLAYTADQLDREVKLLVTEVALLVDIVMGEGAGLRALGLDENSDFAQTRHPDDLSDYSLAIWDHVHRVERYVRDQCWSDSLRADVLWLSHAAERAFSEVVVRGFEDARLANPQPEGPLPGPFEAGAGDFDLAFFHTGILAELVASASARLKVDLGERLTMAEVALLANVKEATVVTNAHRKNFASVEEDNRRYAEARDVLPWLVKNGYRPTLKGGHATEPLPAERAAAGLDLLFVPVANNGSWFGPQCRVDGRYVIGAGRAERRFEDYFTALSALVEMPTPRWRTNDYGVRGMAYGVRFDRVSRVDVERSLAALAPNGK